eukprot:m.11720 g.11720  ORF g.11720 m.11720 type:complete len:406 (+) comp3879_c0_seq1:123-1340(+)
MSGDNDREDDIDLDCLLDQLQSMSPKNDAEYLQPQRTDDSDAYLQPQRPGDGDPYLEPSRAKEDALYANAQYSKGGLYGTNEEPAYNTATTTQDSDYDLPNEHDEEGVYDIPHGLPSTNPVSNPAHKRPQRVRAKEPPSSQSAMQSEDTLYDIPSNMGSLPKLSSSIVSKDLCALCKKPVTGSVVEALGLRFHVDHFQCIKCEQSLAQQQFHKHQGMPFCSSCYHEETAPTCAGCNKAITVTCVKAFGKMWHVDCLLCDQCKKPLGNEFFQVGEKTICGACHKQQGYTCARCGKPATQEVISAMGKYWHADCFTCNVCHKEFPNQQFFEMDGDPYCSYHFHEKKGVICGQCNRSIVGGFVQAMGKKWHKDHFMCNLCHVSLANAQFRERNSQPYCNPCYVKMFGK